ncbi:iron complex transport system ATP-binding protein [Saccharicrinis carchari]|uniref:Iron complex transport system ATP-binding protein n=1 Tax=Saccharicrinis carchari TaxID=1168039 RepID=A0A521E835_SACCC|nr:ABC transporter ATP-binding protein [Saccharicrinis carchari]SMO80115.1 iron complex transport system ATP-binding protein [Saccharicrinis carchari]
MQQTKKLFLRTDQLTIGYDKQALPLHENINVSVKPGQFTCLLGPNGAGKSTLIKTLCGFIKPMSGQVWYGNEKIERIPEAQRAKKISVVLTDRLDVQNLSVFELVALGRTPYTGFFGKLLPRDIQLVYHAIEEVGLKGYTQKSIDKMSDGERQKAMIAKALVQETPFIILDEPAAFLDLPAKIEIMQLLRRLSKEKNRGILLSTHDLEMALQTADKIWLMAQGKTLQEGIPEDLVLNNQFKHFFEREGIQFDNYTGTFKYHKQIQHKINLKGEGNACNWVARALHRIGFATVDEGSKYTVQIYHNVPSQFALYHSNKLVLRCNTIEELMEGVVRAVAAKP